MDERFLFFSDSINDLPLLESVSKAFVCNGDEKNLKIAKERKYKILTFEATSVKIHAYSNSYFLIKVS